MGEHRALTLSFFNRDVNCIRRFFRKRFRFEGTVWPVWSDVVEEWDEYEKSQKAAAGEGEEKKEGEDAAEEETATTETEPPAPEVKVSAVKFEDAAPVEEEDDRKFLRLDLEVEASGFGRQMQRDLEDVSSLYPEDN